MTSWLKNISMRSKILLLITLGAIGSIIVGVIFLLFSNDIRRNVSYLHEEAFLAYEISSNIIIRKSTLERQLYQLILTEDKEEMAALAADIEKCREAVLQLFAQAENSSMSEEKKALFNDVKSDYMKYRESNALVIKHGINNDLENGLAVMNENRKNIGNQISKKLMKIYETEKTEFESVYSKIDNDLEYMFWSTLIVLSCALLVQLLLGCLRIAPIIARRINTLCGRVKWLSDGDMTIPFGKCAKDELGAIFHSLGILQDSLKDTLSVILKVGIEINGRSGVFSATAELSRVEANKTYERTLYIEKSMEELSKNAKSMSVSANEISLGAESTAESTIKMAEQADKARKSGEIGLKMVHDTAESILQLASQTESSAKSVKVLGERANQIQNFVSQISGIADQTNLLALNAAIEAARAGDAGRGFAVVAEEVRKLAEESNSAAKNISKLAEETVKDLDSVLSIVEDGAKESAASVQKTNEMKRVIDEIISIIKMIADGSESLAAVAEEQSASSREISSAIATMSASLLENSGYTSEMKKELAAAASMSEKMGKETADFMILSQDLMKTVSRFITLTPQELADDMLSKIQAHKDFCKKLFSMAETCELIPIQINARHCGLGVLMTACRPPVGYEHWWDKIHEVHDEYHEIGAKIIDIIKDPNKPIEKKRSEAHALAQKGHEMSEVVIKLLETAAADISSVQLRERRKNPISLP